MRRCAVRGCGNTDKSILAHRFPSNLATRKLWQISLDLQEISLEKLIQSFVVCTNHFKKSDYRNSISTFLNNTAVPQLEADVDENLDDPQEEFIKEIADKPQVQAKVIHLTPVKTAESRRKKVIHLTPVGHGLKRKHSTFEEQRLIEIPEVYEEHLEMQAPLEVEEEPKPKRFTSQSVQTERFQFEDETGLDTLLAQNPEFEGDSKTDLIQKVLDRDEQIVKLQAQLKKIQTAMEMFKSLCSGE